MLHLPNDLLRRYCDEPDALLTTEKEHLLSCARCRAAHDRIATNARFAREILGAKEPVVDTRLALQRIRHGSNDRIMSSFQITSSRTALAIKPWHLALAASLIVILFALAPLRTHAGSFLAIFEPHQFAPVAVTRADMAQLKGLPDLAAFGTMSTPRGALHVWTFANPIDASRYARQTIVWPHYLPAQIPRGNTFRVTDARMASFTFSAAKARATASRNGASLPPMPSNIDGSTLRAVIGPVVLSVYGKLPESMQQRARDVGMHRAPRRIDADHFDIPEEVVAVVQAPAPRIYSTRVTVKELEQYLLAQPGVPSVLAAEIRAIGDPNTTMPILIPADRDIAHRVTVQGVWGLAVGDNTGVGSAVIWQRGGIVYGVMAPLTERQTLAVANSLGP